MYVQVILIPSHMTTTLQIRIDSKLKKNVEAILEEMGLDISTLVRMLFKKVEQTKALPFHASAQSWDTLPEYPLSPEEEEELSKISDEVERGVGLSGPFYNVEDMLASLHAPMTAELVSEPKVPYKKSKKKNATRLRTKL